MTIPQLQPDGTLPVGIHDATIAEVIQFFNQHGSTERPVLDTALECVARVIWAADPQAVIYVDGSYVTDKLDPNDVDMLVDTVAFSSAKHLRDLLRVRCQHGSRVQVFLMSQSPSILTDFQRTLAGQPKGLIRLIHS